MVFVTPSQRVTCLVQMLGAVELEFAVVDIDDTLIDTDRRKWAAWCMVLNREIDFAVVKTSSSKEILTGLGCGSDALWKESWKILLCLDRRGIGLLRLDEPIQFAPEVMQELAETLGVVYSTGRTSNMHELTLVQVIPYLRPTVFSVCVNHLRVSVELGTHRLGYLAAHISRHDESDLVCYGPHPPSQDLPK
jgi:hypothetical protein